MRNKIEELKAGDIIEFGKSKKFEFVSRLGEGGTGKTVLINDNQINKKFVCKKYSPVQEEYWEEYYSRFVEEIRIMYEISHKNIIRIFEYYLYPEAKTGYIIMEYIQGLNIEDFFMFYGEEKLNPIFIQIINGFAYLEEHGILHRDIRPQNIMVDDEENVKIIDFGFGKQIEKSTDEKASVILNWPASKMPDEIINDSVYNFRTEIFYVGYLIKNLIEKYEITTFQYHKILSEMTEIDYNKRFSSFKEIVNLISDRSFDDIKFSDDEKGLYQELAEWICDRLANIKWKLELQEDTEIILEKMETVLSNNSLEEYIQSNSDVISCFLKGEYKYYTKNKMEVSVFERFYRWYYGLEEYKRIIVLNNLRGRLKNIPIKMEDDEELPFN